MRRRALLLGLLPAAALAAPPRELRFKVVRDGRDIGTHRVTFAEEGGAMTARTEVAIQVRLAGITVFRFSHVFAETWVNGRLQRAVSRQERNGTVTEMTAVAEAGGILVRGPDGTLRLPAEAAPLSWWDPSRFGRPLFDNDTGKPLRLAWAREALPGGGTAWRCTGDEESEGRYAADGTWLAWRTKAEDGSTVVYERA